MMTALMLLFFSTPQELKPLIKYYVTRQIKPLTCTSYEQRADRLS